MSRREVMIPPLAGELRGWLLLGAGALAGAGGLALLLALSRSPGAEAWMPWDLSRFFRTALVTHVVFAFVVWYLALLGGLGAYVAARAPGGSRQGASWSGVAGLALGAAGSLLLLGVTLANAGEPSLNNYVPVLSTPPYYLGLLLVGLGVAVTLPRLAVLGRGLLQPLPFGVAVCGALLLLALACIGLALAAKPASLPLAGYNEELFWGGGHVLQFLNTGLLLICWQVLGGRLDGQPPAGPALFRLLMAVLLVSALPAPLLYALYDPLAAGHREAFTRLYWIGLPVPPLVLSALVARRLWATRTAWRDPAWLALALSIAVFGLGGLLGYQADGTDTRTPAHYHAVIGGVNLGFMGLLLTVLLPALGRAPRAGWVLLAQFWLYGVGQGLFSLGMYVAGAAGVQRKTAGEAQGLDSLEKVISMGLTGLGGVVAVLGGVLFVWTLLRCLLGRPAVRVTGPPAGLEAAPHDPHSSPEARDHTAPLPRPPGGPP